MSLAHRIRRPFETALTRAARALVPRLSRPAVLCLADGLGGAALRLSGRLRRVGRANLDLAFGDTLSPRRKDEILRASYRSFARMLLDVFWFSRDPERRFREWVEIPADDHARIFADGPAILLTLHAGSWELYGQTLAIRGLPLMSVAAPLANPAVDALFLDMRRITGQQVVAREGAALKLLRQLRRGGKVALLLDQNTKPVEGGVFVPFFGRDVPISTAAAVLALRTGARILLGACLPQPDGRYVATMPYTFLPADFPPADDPDAARELTRRIAAAMEDAVRKTPDHWLWTYKRWKHVPPGGRREEYPFYAKPPPVNRPAGDPPSPAPPATPG